MSDSDKLSLSAATRCNATCDRFEAAWQGLAPPRIEAFLGEVPIEEQCDLLEELLHLDIQYRLVRCHAPTADEYLTRFPQSRELILKVFDQVQATGGGEQVASPPGAQPNGLPAVPGFYVQRWIASGGFGDVYEARHLRLDRVVALKLQHQSWPQTAQNIRARREAELMASVQHPNVVQIYDVGEQHGRLFLSLEYVPPGITLKDLKNMKNLLPEGQLRWRRIAEIAEALAHGVHAAHQKNVLHRDLKPENILLTEDGTPKITDFGLAGQVAGASGGNIYGTPSYMSPEQAQGSAHLTPATDVYSLGAIMYELSTGEPPFPFCGEVDTATLERIANQQVDEVALRQAPYELRAIVLKCLEKKPDKRYQTAEEFAEDLHRLLTNHPVKATRPGPMTHIRKWGRRHPWVARLLALLCLAVLAPFGVWGWFEHENGRQEEQRNANVQASLDDADTSLREKRWADVRDSLERAKGLLQGGGTATARKRLAQAEADMEMADGLEKARLAIAVMSGGNADFGPTRRALAKLFSGYGLDVDGSAEEAIARVRGSVIREELVLALDWWGLASILSGRKSESRRLFELAQAADDNLARAEVRAAVVRGDGRDLTILASRPSAKMHQVSTLFLLGVATEALGDSGTGERLLREGQARYPGDLWLNNQLGYLLAQSGRPQAAAEAVQFFRAAVALRPRSSLLRNNLGFALIKSGRAEEGLAALDEAERFHPPFAAVYVNRSLVYAERNLWAKMERECRQALALDGQLYQAHTNLAVALLQQDRPDEALPEATRACELAPRHAEARGNRATVLLELGKGEEAKRDCLRARDLDPRSALVHCQLSLILYRENDLANSLISADEAIRLDNRFAPAYVARGQALVKQGKVKEGIEDIRKGLALAPNLVMAHVNLAGALLLTGDFQGAHKASLQALQLQPGCFPANINLGAALTGQRKPREALAPCRDAVKARPRSALARALLARTSLAAGHVDLAIGEASSALVLDPHQPLANLSLALAMSAVKRQDEATRHFRLALELKAAPAYDIYMALAACYHSCGRFHDALAAYQKAGLAASTFKEGFNCGFSKSLVSHLIQQEKRLPAVLAGETRPSSGAEAADFAFICLVSKRRYADSERLYSQAFRLSPNLLRDQQAAHRHRAACAAALAACGRCADAPALVAEEKARLHGQAVAWLRSGLDQLLRQDEGQGPPERRAKALASLLTWQLDPDLEAVREPVALAEVPTAQRLLWLALWADIQAAIDRLL